MPVRHRALALLWAALFATFVAGLVTATPVLFAVPMFIAMPIAYYTYREVDRAAELKLRWLYYLLVAMLLVSSAGTAVGSGMTMALDDSRSPLGFLALGTTNVIIAILAWRALLRPSTRAAARAGMLAVVLELIAMVIDVMLNMTRSEVSAEREAGIAIALIGATVSLGTGALACFAALITFQPSRPDVPRARVVEPS